MGNANSCFQNKNSYQCNAKSIQWDYLSKLGLLALFVSGTLFVLYGVVREFGARVSEGRLLRATRALRQARIEQAKNIGNRLKSIEERINLLEDFDEDIVEDIIGASTTRTVNFIIIAIGALLQVVAYVSRFNWALHGQDSIIGMADSKKVW